MKSLMKQKIFNRVKFKKYIFIFLTLIFVLNITPVLAVDGFDTECLEGDVCYEAEVDIPGFPTEKFKVKSNTLGLYIKAIYEYLLYVAGVLAVIVIMIGGFQWITAGGNQSKIGEAKERVTSAIIGLFLALGSYLLLYTITPDLVKIHDLNMPSIMPINDYCIEDQKVTFDPINNPIDVDYDERLGDLGISDFILADQANVTGTEAYCGFNYFYEIEGQKYKCSGTKCNNDEVCYERKCLEPSKALCEGKDTKDSCGGFDGLIPGYSNGWCNQFGTCMLCAEVGDSCAAAGYICPNLQGKCGKGTGDYCNNNNNKCTAEINGGGNQ